MRKYILGITGLLSIAFCLTITSFKSTEKITATPKIITADSIYASYITNLYNTAHLKEAGLNFTVFEKAVTGFFNLKNSVQKIISILDSM